MPLFSPYSSWIARWRPATTTRTVLATGTRTLLNVTLAAATFWLIVVAASIAADDTAFDPAQYSRRAMARRGDAERGRALVADVQRTLCLRCHRVNGTGSEIGPDLSNVGGKLGREHLIESLLEPSRQIVEGYRQVLVATKDGRQLTGLAAGEADGHLTLIDAQGMPLTIPLADIDERRVLDTSVMPERLVAALSPDEFSDLIAYLESLRAAGQSSPGSGVVGPVSLRPGFARETIATGLDGATALAVAMDGRVFVCEQSGALRVLKGDRLLPEPFAVVPVDDQWERGLIGVALDPQFAANGYVYVCYVAREPHPHHRISRFTARGDVADPRSERVLLEGDDQTRLGGQVPAGHQGGAIHFGRDGNLYVAIGEQTAEQPAQSLDSLLGKILRLNRDGTIPDDNPFADRATGKYRAIWAIGCRNPYTFAIDSATGRMFINDVGGKAEEINEGVAGANFGWPLAEHGSTADPRFTGPLHWYPTASICGGAFCPSGPAQHAFPRGYWGKYFFMDFVLGWIKVLDASATTAGATHGEAAKQPIPAELFASGLARPVDLAFAPDGSLYVLLRDAWVRDDKFTHGTGSLHRIRPTQ